MSYAKLFSSITESSLWCEPNEVRILFVSMLAKADAMGFVEAALPGLAKLANLSLPAVKKAVASLESPDPHSKNPDHEGRRIVKVPGGWILLNYEGYRGRKGGESRREYMRNYMQNYRETKRLGSVNSSVSTSLTQKLTNVNSPSASSSLQEQEGETEKLPFTSDAFKAAWERWKSHRREIRKKLTPTSVGRQFAMLAEMGEERAIAMIDYTILKGWTGLREEEPASFGQQRPGQRQPESPAYDELPPIFSGGRR